MNTKEQDLRQDGAFQPIVSAPTDGTLLIGRLATGERCLMRWRSNATILQEDGPDDQREAYWARWHTDKRLAPTEWAPTRLSLQDVLDWV